MHSPEDFGIEPRVQLFQGPIVRRARYLICNNINRILDERRMDDVVGPDEDKSVIYFDGYLIPAVFLACHHLDKPVELSL